MPHLRKENVLPIWKIQEHSTRKNGARKAVFDVKGNSYVGEWQDNKKYGKGIQIWATKNFIYNGNWVNGQRSGYGTLSKYDPSEKKYHCVYAGTWENDKRSGLGINFYTNGGHYDGEWIKGERDGMGQMSYPDGGLYDGEWVNNLRSGQGSMQYANEMSYEGEWLKDMRSGQGILKMPDGNYYEGMWKDDMKNGKGKFFIQHTGVEMIGVWVKNIPRCGTLEVVSHLTAPFPMPLAIPECTLVDPQKVIDEAEAFFQKLADEDH